MRYFSTLFCTCLIVLLLFSCKSEKQAKLETEQIVTRLQVSPKGLNPTMNLSASANAIYPLLFLPMADYDPEKLSFEPILIDQLPKAEDITDGPLKGGIQYTMQIKDEAVWDDGSAITGNDYLFSVKSILHPKTNAVRYRAFLDNIKAISVNETNPKIVTVQFESFNIASMELATSIPILPQHIYDAAQVLDKSSIETLRDELAYEQLASDFPAIDSFATAFNSPTFTREKVQGNGRYKIKEWLTDQYISLEKKENHWLDNSNSATAAAYPKEIIFLLTPDDAAALAQLKSDQFDVYPGLSAQDAEDLKNDPTYADKYDFHRMQIARYYYIAINARKAKLQDKRVRKAMAYLMDVDTIIASYEKGMGERINSQFLSVDDKSTLEDIPYNKSKADALLKEAGWTDSNGNGILDKEIDGKLEELEIDFIGTGSPLGQLISGVYKQLAANSGVNINVINLDRTQFSQRVKKLDFDFFVGGRGQSLAPYDPYPLLHTDNTDPGEGNVSNFGNDASDALIELIRTTNDPAARDQAYLDLEKIMAEEQNLIFLYSPMSNIAVKKGLEGVISIKKPGFAINTFHK